MSEASLFAGRPRGTRDKGYFGRAVFTTLRILSVIISPITKPLATAVGWKRARQFRQDVLTLMSETVANLHPKVVIGATDGSGWYTEIYLNFRDFQIRITRAIYERHRHDFWVDIGSTSDPAVFFRIDFVIEALRRLEKSGDLPEFCRFPNTSAELDATIWAMHDKLAEHLSAVKYAETRSMIQLVMHE